MNLSDVDLNLFVVFDAIYRHQNLTRAGEIIGITQPAVSNSLARLRKLFNDPLFVRTSEGMIPTPVAQNIIGSIRQSLELMRSSVQESESFDPKMSEKRFRISMTDLSQAMLLPRLFELMKQAAPGVSIECYQVRRRDMNIELASGNLDLAIDIPLTPDPHIRHSGLVKDPYVCLIDNNNSFVKDQLSRETYLKLQHIHISTRRGGLGLVDLALGKRGKKRNIVLRTQHYLAAPQLLRDTNFALTIPQTFADSLAMPSNTRYLKLPFEVPPLESFLYWHESTDCDQSNKWMRKLIEKSYRVKQDGEKHKGSKEE
ncbi:MAG: LysR family transcriptional regulator [Gammaproteobacteria bacterium]|mgnify:FL=1|nr:LysR family transcriptional regulator [Gammaproteobacteria bacterium]